MSPTRGWSNVIVSYPPPFSVVTEASAIGMINLLPIGLALLDHDGNCFLTNAVFAETVGCDCVAAGILDLAIPADRLELARVVADTLASRHDGTDCRLRLMARPDEAVVVTVARAPAGWRFGALVVVRDIREQLRLERQVAQVTKMQAVGQLAGGIAHDFNNILTANLGLCDQLLERHAPGTADFDDLDQLRQNINRASNLVRQLLAFSRQQTLRPELLDVVRVIDGLRPLVQRLIGADVELVIAHHGDAGPVRADPGQLEQVMTNLAVNARDAMAGRGQLTITTRRVAARSVEALGHTIIPAIDLVAITVADTGSGIAPEIAAKIFEPFFTTKPIGQGTGLGLSTVYGIVKQTGGFVYAAPIDAGGTCFTVYLPAAPGEAIVPAPPPPRDQSAVEGTALLVEDDRGVRLVVERALRRHGLNVIAAADGEAALEILDDKAVVIDVLVSDVVMPGIDGVKLLDAARIRRPGLAAVLMSGYAELPQRRALDDAGVVFLAKPFAVGDLLDAVRHALAVPPGASIAPVLDTAPGAAIDT